MNASSVLADAVVVLHFAYVMFVLIGLLAILIGYVCKWSWVRNLWFRLIHFAMILIVVVEALAGIVCPLTTLENYLRSRAGQTVHGGSFVGRVVHQLMFFDAPNWVFTSAYCIFGGLVLLAFLIVPPNWRNRSGESWS